MEQTAHIQSGHKTISIFGALALSIGTSIGWGSFMVTGSSYLSKAGPLGSFIGLVIGLGIMLVVAYNYQRMVNKYPYSGGGLYTYVKKTFGADHAFLASWFLILIYFAIFWANLTSIPLFARYIFGDVFQFGFHYAVGGYDVYLGEILLSLFFIILVGSIAILSKKVTMKIEIGAVGLFVASILAVFIVAMVMHHGGFKTFSPAFAPTDENEFLQVVGIISMTPWAFIGFESITNSSHRFNFDHKKTFKIFVISLVVTAVLYLMLCLISISDYPDSYSSWYEFLNDSSREGLNAVAPFYVTKELMGNAGVVIFAITLFLIVITSLFGNMIGLSNLLQSMAEDEAMPLFLKKLDKNETPRNAILAIMTVSFIIPFIGRVAIGWIVDVNTIGGSIVYTYIGATALKSSLEDKDKKSMVSGILGIAFGFAFSLIILIPNLFIEETMAKETFFIFVIWAIAGFIYFYYILRKDKKGLFGHSLFVLLGLVLLILLSSFIWANDVIEENNRDLINKLDIYYHTSSTTNDNYVFELEKASNRTVVGVVLTMILVIFIAQLILLASFIMIKKREVQHQKDLDIANELATKDSMTGVRNKHAYSTKENLMDEAINSNDNLEFAVVVCDVNNLKYINDNFGHEYGDKLIKDACALICNTFEHSPVYRVGGDEFVVILEGRDYQNRDELISKINATIEKNNLEEGIVIAIGISQFDKEKHFEFIDVFREADQNMYIRKQNLKEMKRNAKK